MRSHVLHFSAAKKWWLALEIIFPARM